MRQISLILILLLSTACFSQEQKDKTTYLDERLVPIAEGLHTYYKVVSNYSLDIPLYPVHIYYNSGQLRTEGQTSNKTGGFYEGELKTYLEDGQLILIETFKNGVRAGTYKRWYPNGQLCLEGEILPNLKDPQSEGALKINNFWNTANVITIIDGNGEYALDDGEITEKGQVKNGFRDGEWVGTNYPLSYTFSEKYLDGKLLNGVSIDPENKKQHYSEIMQKPVYKSGMSGFYRYIGKNFKTPTEDLYGRILLSFVVDQQGRITDVRVIESLSEAMDNEGIRLLEKCKRWEPARIRGVKVRCSFQIPIAISRSR